MTVTQRKRRGEKLAGLIGLSNSIRKRKKGKAREEKGAEGRVRNDPAGLSGGERKRGRMYLGVRECKEKRRALNYLTVEAERKTGYAFQGSRISERRLVNEETVVSYLKQERGGWYKKNIL